MSVGAEAEVPTLKKKKRVGVGVWEGGKRAATYGVFVVGVGTSAVAPDVVHADDD